MGTLSAFVKQNRILKKWVYKIYNFRGLKLLNYKSNTLIYEDCLFKNSKIFFFGKNNKITFEGGDSTFTNLEIIIYGNNNNVTLGKSSHFVDTCLWIEDDGNKLNIGSNNIICGKTQIAAIEGTNISIGNGCLFSTNVIFRTGDSHSILNKISSSRINPSKDIVIGNRVWFGADTKILKGVQIQDDTIVGIGSIVNKTIDESNVIIAGVPAKIVKHNIKWDAKRIPMNKLGYEAN